MKEKTSNGSAEIIAQAIEKMKAEQGAKFSTERMNLAELERRTDISRAKLRRLKKQFQTRRAQLKRHQKRFSFRWIYIRH